MGPQHLKKFAVELCVAVLLFTVAVPRKEGRSWETLCKQYCEVWLKQEGLGRTGSPEGSA